MSKDKARLEILSELMSFPTINQKDWETDFTRPSDVRIGDLVSLNAAPSTRWYVSWVREIEQGDNSFCTKYLLESIDDGSLCWWSNVGLNVYSRERVKERPTWQWDDRQHTFYRRWNKVCYKRNGAHLILPRLPEFKDDAVILDVRVRFNFSGFQNPKEFPNWKKLTMKEMGVFYKQCVAKEAKYKEPPK